MKYEVEQKFRTAEFATVRAELQGLDARFSAAITQTDQYFAHPSRDFGETDEALRIRQVGDQAWVTYKGPKVDRTTKTRRELEFPLPDPKQFGELLTLLGFRPVLEVRKERQTADLVWAGLDVEVALDDVAGVGNYVELEISADAASLDAARQALASLAERFGLTENERRSYLELLMTAQHRD